MDQAKILLYAMTQKKEYQDLWERFIGGDDSAFSLLFENLSDSLFDYGSRFVTDDNIVKDCIQDLFIKLLSQRSKLPLIENPRFYLFKALKNLIINALSRNNRFVYLDPNELPFYAEYTLDKQPSDNSFDDDLKDKFLSVIKTLTPRQKEAIYLRYQEGMTYDEIAQTLDIKYQSIRNLIHRALEKIRSEMDLKVFLLIFLNQI